MPGVRISPLGPIKSTEFVRIRCFFLLLAYIYLHQSTLGQQKGQQIVCLDILFEVFTINYRPVLIDGYLEISYPSSTAMLVMCVMPTAIMQFGIRIKNNVLKGCVTSAITAFIIFMVIGRLVSGVHWFTDIIGGALLSAGLVLMYRAVISQEVR